jgi:hypothetical protein
MNIVLFDKPYPRDKMVQGLGVSYAVATGKCGKCEYLPECETNSSFVLPDNAACMVCAALLLGGAG